MNRIKLYSRTFALLLCTAAFICTGCSNYWVKPYEKSNVSRTPVDGLVISTVKFVDAGGTRQMNFVDYYYKGADDYDLTFALKEYFIERTATPQVEEDVPVTIDPRRAGVIALGETLIKVYVANDDEIIFQVLQAEPSESTIPTEIVPAN